MRTRLHIHETKRIETPEEGTKHVVLRENHVLDNACQIAKERFAEHLGELRAALEEAPGNAMVKDMITQFELQSAQMDEIRALLGASNGIAVLDVQPDWREVLEPGTDPLPSPGM